MIVKSIAKIIAPILRALNYLTPLGDLLARLWVAKIFLQSGMIKIENWQSTVNLFTYVYHVPILSPHFAAILGTTAELVLPVMLILGLGGRITILIFFVYNIFCVVSYNFLWTPQGTMGLDQHINWGLLLMLLMFHGSGKLSLDNWLFRKHGHHMNIDRRINIATTKQ